MSKPAPALSNTPVNYAQAARSAAGTAASPLPPNPPSQRAPSAAVNGQSGTTSGRATPAGADAAGVAVPKPPAGPPAAAINFGTLNDASSTLSSSPAPPSHVGAHLQPGGQLAFGSFPSTDPSHGTGSKNQPASSTATAPAMNGRVPEQVAPGTAAPKKFDFNSFFQGGGAGSASSSATPSGPSTEASSASSSAAPTPAVASIALPEMRQRRSSAYEASVSSSTSSPRLQSATLAPQGFATQQPGFAPSPHPGGLPGGTRPFSPGGVPYAGNMVYMPQSSYSHQRAGSSQMVPTMAQVYQNGTPRPAYAAPPPPPPTGTGARPVQQRMNSSQTPTSPRMPNSPLPSGAMPYQYAGYPPQWFAQNGQYPQFYPYGFGAATSPYLAAQQQQAQTHQPQHASSAATSSSPAPAPVNGAASPATQRASTTSSATSTLSVSSTAAPSTVPTRTSTASSMKPDPTASAFNIDKDFVKSSAKSKAIMIRRPDDPAAKPIELKKTPSATKPAAPLAAPVEPTVPVQPAVPVDTEADAKAKQAAAASEAAEMEKEQKAKEARDAAEAEKERLAKQEAEAKEAAAAEAKKRQDEMAAAEATRLEKLQIEDKAAKAEADKRLQKETEERERVAAEEAKRREMVAEEQAAESTSPQQRAPALVDASAPPPQTADMPAIIAAVDEGELDGPSPDASQAVRSPALGPLDESAPSSRAPSRTSTPPPQPSLLEIPAKREGPPALATATPLQSLADVTYPAGISAPVPELNMRASPGRFRYDRDFLAQFQRLCLERPEGMPDAESLGMTDNEGGYTPSTPRSSTGRYGRAGAMPPPPPRQPSMGMAGNRNMPQAMGSFGTGPAKSSEARFQQATAQMAMGGFGSGGFGGKGGVGGRTPSQQMGSRSGSKRGSNRAASHAGGARGGGSSGVQYGSDGLPVAPLQKTENAWSDNINKGKTKQDDTSPEMVHRKVKALLNKLTVDNFDSISKQILVWANKSADETDGRILRQVIQLIFEKATDEASWSTMYAKLCRMLQDLISDKVQDLSMKDPKGGHFKGGSLFRKYLLNRCQEDYERGWANRDAMTAAAASRAGEDEAKRAANEAKEAAESSKGEPKEAELLSDEYYAAQKAKRQGLGLVKFIGELYKLSMLTGRIMHECVQKLLREVDTPEEEDVESLCRLLTTVGHMLDGSVAKNADPAAQKSAGFMKIYFDRLELLRRNERLSSRIRFMIQDLQELRQNGWQGRTEVAGPKSIAEVHADAARASAEEARRVASGGRGVPRMGDPSLTRGGSRSGIARAGADGWSTIPPAAPPARPSKAGDLKGFGQVRTPSSSGGPPTTFGPSGAFAIKGRANASSPSSSKDPPSAPETPRANAFAALENAESGEADATGSRPRLNLAPRTLPLEGEGEGDDKADEDVGAEGEDDGPTSSRDEAAIKRSIDNSIKEFFELKDFEEAVLACQQLAEDSRRDFVAGLSLKVIDMRDQAVDQLCDLFERFQDEDLLTGAEMGEALKPLLKDLDDLASDAPKAFPHAAKLLRTTDLVEEDIARLAEVMESIEGDDEEALQEVRDRILREWRVRAPAEAS